MLHREALPFDKQSKISYQERNPFQDCHDGSFCSLRLKPINTHTGVAKNNKHLFTRDTHWKLKHTIYVRKAGSENERF